MATKCPYDMRNNYTAETTSSQSQQISPFRKVTLWTALQVHQKWLRLSLAIDTFKMSFCLMTHMEYAKVAVH